MDRGNAPKLTWAQRLQAFRTAHEKARKAGDVIGEGQASFYEAFASAELNRPADAIALYSNCVKCLDDSVFLDCALNNLGVIYALNGARPREALYLFLSPGDPNSQTEGEQVRLGAVHLNYFTAPEQESQDPIGFFARIQYSRALGLPGQGAANNNLGAFSMQQGHDSDAITAFDVAQTSFADGSHRRIGVRRSEAKSWDYMSPEYYEKVKLGDAIVWENIGWGGFNEGAYSFAMGCYEPAVEELRGLNDSAFLGTALSRMGELESLLGQFRQAQDHLGEAADLQTRAGDESGLAQTFMSMGKVADLLKDKQGAQEAYRKAFELQGKLGDKPGQALTAAHLDPSFKTGGGATRPTDSYENLIRPAAGRDMSTLATKLCDLGTQYAASGDKNLALKCLAASLFWAGQMRQQNIGLGPDLQELTGFGQRGDIFTERRVLETLARLESEEAPKAAAWFQSKAVRILEGQRSGGGTFNDTVKHGFLESDFANYVVLARLYAEVGRCAEAQQVLSLTKVDPIQNTLSRIPETPAEKRWSASLRREINRADYHRNQRDDFYDDVPDPTGSGKTVRMDLQEMIAQDCERIRQSLMNSIEESKNASPDQEGAPTSPVSLEVAEVLKSFPEGCVAVYALPGTDEVTLIVIANGKTTTRSVPAKDLSQRLRGFRQAVTNPRLDPRIEGKALYDVLLGPIQDLLKPGGTTLWFLGGVLRGLPISALYDGSKFVLEKYPSCLFDPALFRGLTDAPRRNGPALVFGSTLPHAVKDPATGETLNFDRLPGAAAEAAAVGKSLGTAPKLDEAFTSTGLLQDLKKGPSMIHLATHFRYVPGDDERSFLVTGNGQPWTLQDIKAMRDGTLGSIDLLTLSACATAEGQTAGGEQAESFGEWLQMKGAKAVISTLWPVADESTATLMSGFYSLWKQHPDWTKLRALREAQINMLAGRTQGRDLDGQRSGSATGGSTTVKGPPWPTTMPRYAHPYYWAPFALSGNWR